MFTDLYISLICMLTLFFLLLISLVGSVPLKRTETISFSMKGANQTSEDWEIFCPDRNSQALLKLLKKNSFGERDMKLEVKENGLIVIGAESEVKIQPGNGCMVIKKT